MIQKTLARAVGLVIVAALAPSPGWPQSVDRLERERAQAMLQNVASDVRKHYFDPTLRGVDLDAQVKVAQERIAKATTREELPLDIAAALEAFQDSHTYFVPPRDPISQEYGFRYEMVGAHCYVTQVQPKSDAQNKGVKPGDEVLTINGFTPTIESLSKISYVVNTLVPQASLRLDLRDRTARVSRVEVLAKLRHNRAIIDHDDVVGRDHWRLRLENEDLQRLMRPQSREFGKELMILKLPMFSVFDQAAERVFEKSRDHRCLIVDLRSNPGGAEPTLQELLGSVFKEDVRIAERISREKTLPVIANGRHNKAFGGKLIVLVDSQSASAAELFARVVQIEKRGIVLGDRTSGSVMESRYYSHETGSNPYFLYGVSVSSADLEMSDGMSLEHGGVTPDQVILPSAADLASGRDPVLARAAEIAGVKLSPEEAGKLFSFEWPMN